MITTLPNTAQGVRVAIIYDWTWISIRAVAPNGVRIGCNRAEVETVIGSGGASTSDGLEILPTDGAPYSTWWKGELWMAALVGPAQAIVLTPGKERLLI